MTQYELFKPSAKPWTPHSYQKKAVKFLLEHAAGALFLDPGLGKTSITLAAIKMLKQKKVLDKVLLIAPLRVCYSVWPKEVEKWEDFNDIKVVVLHGPNKDALLKTEADVYVINPEGLEWLLQVEKTKTAQGKTKVSVDLRRWKQLGFDTLVVDELSKFKHINTNRFKALKLVLHTFRRRWGLTGSPAPNGLMDLFGQCYILDQGRTLGQYITHYRMKYFVPSHDGFSWNIREGAEQEIYERLSPLALRMAADDYLDMPTLIENNIRVDLPEKVMEIYDRLENDLIAKLDAKVVVASNAAAASMKCRQVANGGIYLDPEVEALVKLPKSKREWVNLHTEKVDALADLIEELQGSPILVAYDFEHDLDRLRERLGQDVPYIGGGVSAKRSAELEKAWNAGRLPVLLGHPQAMAHGLNLQEVGHHVCWHSLTWDYELYDQFIRRVLRQGNKSKKVFVHHIIARNTIDHAILAAVKSKRNGQNALFAALKSLKRSR
jgi:SNF2 family DNA or RNA helicase